MGTDIHPFHAAAGPIGGSGGGDARDRRRTEVGVPYLAYLLETVAVPSAG